MNKFKAGDRVVCIIKRHDDWFKVGEIGLVIEHPLHEKFLAISNLSRDISHLTGDKTNWTGMEYYRFELESVYNSPLYQALKEDNEKNT